MDGPRLADFEGAWRIARRVEDRVAGARARFDGQGVFLPMDGGLRYDETGILDAGGRRMAATRRYFWRQDGDGLAVFFDDRRPFHRIDPGATPEARHDCAPDLYRVRYDFRAWPDWTAEWHVTGPRKDYTMLSRYRRDAAR